MSGTDPADGAILGASWGLCAGVVTAVGVTVAFGNTSVLVAAVACIILGVLGWFVGLIGGLLLWK